MSMEEAVAQAEDQHPITVSVIMPMYNAALWLAEALDSVLGQSLRHGVELSIFNDSSVDDSMGIIESYREKFLHRGIRLTVTDGGCVSGGDGCCRGPRGVGFAKNRAIEASCGEYLCFLDSVSASLIAVSLELIILALVCRVDRVVLCLLAGKT
eukprot:scpid103298/ scgid1646/ UDP-GlcNAc:betaGal beta-1,3-N-acetylglucosaminyltransferase-like protein 1; Beta-1,3-N-acetylglucosaminyltransferase 8